MSHFNYVQGWVHITARLRHTSLFWPGRTILMRRLGESLCLLMVARRLCFVYTLREFFVGRRYKRELDRGTVPVSARAPNAVFFVYAPFRLRGVAHLSLYPQNSGACCEMWTRTRTWRAQRDRRSVRKGLDSLDSVSPCRRVLT
jgi:hypothetical protein